MEPIQRILSGLVDNLNEVNKAINLSMMVTKMMDQLIGKSNAINEDREESNLLAIQLNSQLQSLKHISDENERQHERKKYNILH